MKKKFDVKIYKVPSTLYTELVDNALFQLPLKSREKFRNNISQYYLDYYTKDKMDDILEEMAGGKNNVIRHIGIKYTDGVFRYQSLMKYGCLKDNVFRPIASFKVSDIKDILRKYDCYLPIEYKLWGISFESSRAFNLKLIQDNCPESYKEILQYFPLMGTLKYQDDYNKLNHHFKSRITQFGEFAIPKELYEKW